jgi:hypothetical protein
MDVSCKSQDHTLVEWVIVTQMRSSLMSLKPSCSFSPGFWGELSKNAALLSGIAIPDEVFQQNFSNSQFRKPESFSGFQILAGLSLKDPATARKLESLTWYGCPGRILFFSHQPNFADILLYFYEQEEDTDWPDWAKDMQTDMQQILDLLMKNFADASVCWCFSCDADFAVCSVRCL